MRVAVCLSGQLRGWELGWINQTRFWNSKKDFSIDFFAHTWSYSWDREGVSQPYVKRDVSVEEFLEFANSFQTKKAILEPTPQTKFKNSDHWGGLFYSLVKSIMLKREYELKNNFTYDLVIKSRPDIVINPKFSFYPPIHLVEDGVIFTTQGANMPSELNMFNFNDMVFMGNSYTMDLLINMFAYRMSKIDIKEDNVHPLGPGVLLHEFFRDYGITPFFRLEYKETLLKLGCPTDLDLLDEMDFREMENYFRKWYTK